MMTNTFEGMEKYFAFPAGALTNKITLGIASLIGMCGVLYFVLKKPYRDFSIRLVKNSLQKD